MLGKLLGTKVLLYVIAALVAANLGTFVLYRMADAGRDAAVAKADAASAAAHAAVARAEELAGTNGEWQDTVTVMQRKLGDAQRENVRLAEDNRLALEQAQKRIDEAERSRRQALAKRDAAAAADPGCRAFLEMPLCPALQSSR